MFDWKHHEKSIKSFGDSIIYKLQILISFPEWNWDWTDIVIPFAASHSKGAFKTQVYEKCQENISASWTDW